MIINFESDLADCWTVQTAVKYLPVAQMFKNDPRDIKETLHKELSAEDLMPLQNPK